jgi:proline racemase
MSTIGVYANGICSTDHTVDSCVSDTTPIMKKEQQCNGVSHSNSKPMIAMPAGYIKPGATTITTVEMHTGGAPVRIIGPNSGMPNVDGKTLTDKRKYAQSHLDNYRKFLIFEPRGHKDMYGMVIVKPDHPEADIAVLFMDNGDFTAMCGHCTIALGRYAVDHGLVKALTYPETRVNIQCPCGLVETYVQTEAGGKSSRTRFLSVPAFVYATGTSIFILFICIY